MMAILSIPGCNGGALETKAFVIASIDVLH